MSCRGGFDLRNEGLGYQWKSESLPELHRGFVELFLEGGAELVAVLGDDLIDQGNRLGASANAPLWPSGAGGATSLELGGVVHGASVFETPEKEDCALSKAACSARMRARSSLRNLWGVNGKMNWRA